MRKVIGACLGAGAASVILTLAASRLTRAAAPGSFQPVGPMTMRRYGPTLTLLPDGSVLVAGGQSLVRGIGNVSVHSTERFDPKTNQFTPSADMTVSRQWHSAVRLQDGRVLLLGGIDGRGQVLAAAEVFDPASGAFTRVGDMTTPRWDATATLLPDDRVLVAGGIRDRQAPQFLDTAELFDPATGSFQRTGSLAQPRAQHAAVALPDGRVALLGGARDQSHAVRSVEIYDPATGAFTLQGASAADRVLPTALAAAGQKILLAGGYSPGIGSDALSGSIEIDDLATKQATITSTLTPPQVEPAAVRLADGRILLAGGWATMTDPLQTTVIIDPATGQSSPGPSMRTPRAQAGAVLLPDGRALIAGGIGAGQTGVLDTAEVYVP